MHLTQPMLLLVLGHVKVEDGKRYHTNAVESSFSLLKRGIIGAFHHVSKKHLHRYTGEFDFRWTNRKVSDVERTAQALKQSKGKRLMIQTLMDNSKVAGHAPR